MGLSIQNNTVKVICMCGEYLLAKTMKCHVAERPGEKVNAATSWGGVTMGHPLALLPSADQL